MRSGKASAPRSTCSSPRSTSCSAMRCRATARACSLAPARSDDERCMNASTTEILRIAGLNKWYDSYHALRHIDLTVATGERIVVCGPSGSGKSTLIRCINGIEAFEQGELRVCGIALGPSARKPELSAVRRQVGMVFQEFNLFPHMTVLQNCTLAPVSTHRLSSRDADAAAMELLARVRVQDHAHKYPSQLSGGQQQRVAIARALCMNPSLMLFD